MIDLLTAAIAPPQHTYSKLDYQYFSARYGKTLQFHSDGDRSAAPWAAYARPDRPLWR